MVGKGIQSHHRTGIEKLNQWDYLKKRTYLWIFDIWIALREEYYYTRLTARSFSLCNRENSRDGLVTWEIGTGLGDAGVFLSHTAREFIPLHRLSQFILLYLAAFNSDGFSSGHILLLWSITSFARKSALREMIVRDITSKLAHEVELDTSKWLLICYFRMNDGLWVEWWITEHWGSAGNCVRTLCQPWKESK
jgi:hypothetical protein